MSDGVEPLIRVTVARSEGGELEVFSRRHGQRIELLPIAGRLPRYEAGERLSLRRPVAGDATYAEPVVVSRADADSALVTLAGERRRHQQREHVRVDTPQLTMRLIETPDDDAEDGDDSDPRELDARVLDLSAGGARVEHVGPPLQRRSLWTAQATLTYEDGRELGLDQVVEVRWSVAPDGTGEDADESDSSEDDQDEAVHGRALAGLRFTSMRPVLEESVTRWVFQQQARMLRVRRQGG